MAVFRIHINEKGGQRRTQEYDKGEVLIGRVQGNDVVLPKGNISKRHARIVVKDSKFIIIDMQSTNGTYVNGKKINAPQVIKAADKIYIGDFTLQLEAEAAEDRRSEPELELPSSAGPESAAPRSSSGLLDDNFDQDLEPRLPSPPLPASETPDPSIPAPSIPAPSSTPPPAVAALSSAPLDEPETPAPDVLPPASSAPPPIPERIASSESSAGAPEGLLSAQSSAPPPLPASSPAAPGGLEAPRTQADQGLELGQQNAIRAVRDEIADHLGLRGAGTVGSLLKQEAAIRLAAKRASSALLTSGLVGDGLSSNALADLAVGALLDFSAVDALIDDDEVHEIVVTHQLEIFADRDGHLQSTGVHLDSQDQLVALVERFSLLADVDPSLAGLLDARLACGSRVLATLPPLSFRGPTLSYRKASREAFSLEDLVQHGALSEPMMRLLDLCVRYRKGILLVVGPGVSASASLNALASIITADERIVTIESGVELHLGHQNVVALEAPEGGISELVDYATRLQPDRLLVGTVAGADLAAALTAMGGVLHGGIVSYAAPSVDSAIARIVDQDLGEHLNPQALLQDAAVLVLEERRFIDGSRRITRISELVGDGDNGSVKDIFQFEADGFDESGLVTGAFRATGEVPDFVEQLTGQGVEVDSSIFAT